MVDVSVDFVLERDEPIQADFELEPDVTYTADIMLSSASSFHNELYNRDLPDQHPMSAITDLEETLESKVDKTDESSKVYGTDENGEQTTYELDSFGKVDDVQVGGVSVVTNKVAELGTMAGETASDYSTTAVADTLYANISYEETINNHIADKSNPHEVTKAQVGLGNCDNTSDLDKPISTATQEALDNKQATISDLSTIRENATHGESAYNTISGYGDIVTHNANEFATAAQGALADTAVQPNDLATVATSGSYNDLSNKPTIGNATLTIQKNGVNVDTFTANATSDKVINITVPTTSSDVGALPDTTTINDLTTTAQQAALNSGATSTNIGQIATNTQSISDEVTNRQNADIGLQNQIDAIVSASDVFDIVGTYAELQAYDISTVPVNDIIKVLVDSTHSGAATYYRCVENGGVKSWSYIGSEGAYYTKAEADSNFVPQTRTVNSKALSSDITLTASDVGALPSSTVIPTVNDATVTIQKNGNTVSTFTLNQSSNETVNLTVPTATSDLTNDSGFITSADLPTNYVTTDTAQDISAKKTFLGEKAILFKQTASTDKLGFTLYTSSNSELGAFEYRPNTISGSALLNVNCSYSASAYVGFRYWGTAVNIIAPKVATAGNYFIPVNITDGNTTVTAGNNGTVNISSFGYIKGINSSDVTTALGYTPVNPSSLATVATSGSYNDLLNKPTIPTVNNATLTIQKNSTNVATFTANASSNVTADISVPTKVSDLSNDSGFITGISSSDVTTALGYTPADDSNVVKTSGNQTIAGEKTFSSQIKATLASYSATSGATNTQPYKKIGSCVLTGTYQSVVIPFLYSKTTIQTTHGTYEGRVSLRVDGTAGTLSTSTSGIVLSTYPDFIQDGNINFYICYKNNYPESNQVTCEIWVYVGSIYQGVNIIPMRVGTGGSAYSTSVMTWGNNLVESETLPDGYSSKIHNVSDVYAKTQTSSDSSTKIATTAFVKAQGYALDSNVVKTTGNQTVGGVKTFSSGINVGDATEYKSQLYKTGGGHLALAINKQDNSGWLSSIMLRKTGEIEISPSTNVTAPTPATSDNSTKIATTAFVNNWVTANTSNVHVVVDTYKSGSSWYRIYDDGWIEQGGWKSGFSSANTFENVTLHKPFADTYYNVQVSGGGSATTIYNYKIGNSATNTTTAFKLLASNTGAACFWYACGQGA